MKSLIRIAVVVFVLVGGTAFFGYWSTNQFDEAFNNLSAAYSAITPQVYFHSRQNLEPASTSPETSGFSATTTNPKLGLTSTSTATTTATTTNPKLVFNFPKKGAVVYVGCTYPISWQSSTTIDSLGIALIDAGTRETVGPNTGGLAKENTIEKDSQTINWKVGSVWPGSYYIKISRINGINTEIRSSVFTIKKSEQKNICEESGSLF